MKNKDKFSIIRYANCWEDSKILRQGLQIKAGQIGLSIASGGDNTFALLLDNPQQIYAFDRSKPQLYLMELKMRAIENLEYQQLLEFLGIENSPSRLKLFASLKTKLSKEAVGYFENNIIIIEQGIIHAGKFEAYFQLFRKYICPLYCSRKKLETFTELNSLSEQKSFYAREIDNWRFKAIFKLYFGMSVMGKLGRDKSFYRYLDDKENIAEDIKRRFEYGISHSINQNNPYLSYILRGNYRSEALPEYLQPANYPTIKNNLHKIKLINRSLMEVESDIKFDFFNLSDIFEYLSEEDFVQNLAKLSALSQTGARFAYWNMQHKRYFNSDDFIIETELSKQLFDKNQSIFYRDFSIYRKREHYE